jgi:hypothetical protein
VSPSVAATLQKDAIAYPATFSPLPEKIVAYVLVKKLSFFLDKSLFFVYLWLFQQGGAKNNAHL